MDIKEAGRKILDIALDIDESSIRHDVNSALDRFDKCEDDAAWMFIRGDQFRTGASGALTGLTSSPLTGAASGVADAGYVLRRHLKMGARIALVYDPNFLDTDYPRWELLAPILGTEFIAQYIQKKVAVPAAKQTTKRLIKKFLSKGTLKAFKRFTKKYLGKKVLQKTVLSKTVPFVGSGVSAVWNIVETRAVGQRVIQYSKGESLS